MPLVPPVTRAEEDEGMRQKVGGGGGGAERSGDAEARADEKLLAMERSRINGHAAVGARSDATETMLCDKSMLNDRSAVFWNYSASFLFL